MQRKIIVLLIFAWTVSFTFGQKSTFKLFSPDAIGIAFTQGNEHSFLFDDPDYFYRTNTIKFQFYYPLTTWRKLDISLIIQPQIQFVQHQLYNAQFVRPEEANYQEKRAKYTRLKNLKISALEWTIDVKTPLFKSTSLFVQFGLGFAIIDTSTERLIGGFTFLENLNTGLETTINPKINLRIHAGIGHVSNLNFKLPNAGYNIFNIGLGVNYLLH